MEFLLGVLYVGITIYIANMQDVNGKRSGLLRYLLYGLVGMMFFLGLIILMTLASPEAIDDLSSTQVTAALHPAVVLVFTLVCFVLGAAGLVLIRSGTVRQHFARLMTPYGRPDGGFNPDSAVHLTALLLVLLQTCYLLTSYVVLGGLGGVAQSIQDAAPDLNSLLFNAMLYVLLALLGVGFMLRRDPQQTLDRLGLRLPTRQDLTAGLGMGLALFLALRVFTLIWLALASPEMVEQQTAASEQIFQLYSETLLSGFILALSAAVGEEILFRGAMQPIFGVLFTSLFFALLHLQYTLTPATVIIFFAALGFAWLRRRYSTTAAIAAHFVYNFIPFLLLSLGSAVSIGG